jgi:O-antigen/teichoic acid export membrane protein
MMNLVKVVAPTVVIKGFAVLAAFLMNLIVVRKLGVEDSGYFFWFFSIVLILGVIARFGLDQGVVRIAASSLINSNEKLAFFLLVFFLVLITSSIIAIGLFMYSEEISYFLNSGDKTARVIESGAALIVLSSLLFLVSSFYQAEGKSVSYVLYVSLLVPLLVLIFMLVFKIDDIFGLLFLYESVVFAVVLVASMLLLRGYCCNAKVTFKPKGYSNFLFGLWVVSIMMILNQWYGQIFISVYGDIVDVAKFSVAQKISMLFTSVTVVISAKYSGSIIKSPEDWALVYKSINRLVLYSFSLVFAVAIFSEEILSVFGVEYVDQKYVLIGLVLSQWVNVIYAVQNWKVIAKADTRIIIYNGFILLACNLMYVFVFFFLLEGVIEIVMLAMLAGNVTAVLFQRALIKRVLI